MKRLLLIVLPLLLIVGCSSPEPINYKETLNERDGVFYTKDTNKPYSGSIFSLDYKGRKRMEGVLENGKLITHKEFKWYKNGQKKWEVTFKDGKENELRTYFGNDGKEYKGILIEEKNRDLIVTMKKNGTLNGSFFRGDLDDLVLLNFKNGDEVGRTMWYKNGQKQYEETFKNGETDGLRTDWYKNGQKRYEETLKVGYRDGLTTAWYQNGQKGFEGTYKKDEEDGLHIEWYENGQKKREVTFKDGIEISKKEWNEDGSVKE